jgi:replicative DNA helicase
MYGKGSVRAIIVDYLDLLRSDSSNDLYRLELSFITAGLKDISVKYNCPVLSPTQLGRAVYRNKEAGTLNLDMMSESIKKVEHADFICLMSKDQTNGNNVYLKVGKNRCGKDNISIDFRVSFKHYKFLDGLIAVNEKKSDAIKDQSIEVFDMFDDRKKKKKKENSFTGLYNQKDSI